MTAPKSLSARRRAGEVTPKPPAKTAAERSRELLERVRAEGGKKLSAYIPGETVRQIAAIKARDGFGVDIDVIISAVDALYHQK